MSSEDRPKLALAVERMIANKDVNSLIEVLELFSFPNLQVAALKALGDIGDARAVQPIADELRDWRNEHKVLLSALDALAKIGPPSVKPLIEVMSRESAHGRYTFEMLSENAAKALAKIGEPAVEPLIKALEKGSESWWFALVALADIGDARAVAPFLKLLKRDFVGSVIDEIVEALVKIGSAAVQPLLAALDDESDIMRSRAARALGEIRDTRAFEPLTRALRDRNSAVWSAALRALVNLEDQRAVALFIKYLADDEVGAEAAWALGSLGDPKAVDPLIQCLVDNRASVRKNAALALGAIGDKRAVDPLVASLADEHSRSEAARALGEIGDTAAVKPLIQALRTKDETLRSTAAWSLGSLRDAKAVNSLARLLKDKNISNREIAAKALAKIGEPAVKPLVNALITTDTRKCASEALLEIGKSAVTPLIGLLQDRDRFVRGVAAKILGDIGDSSSADALLAATKDPQVYVRTKATEALSKLQNRQNPDTK